MTTRTIKPGYVAIGKTRKEILSSRYPFRLLKEGDYIDPPWPLQDLQRVRSAVRTWNQKRQGCLHVSVYQDGLNGHGPCVVVGWPMGAVHVPVEPRKRGPKLS